ncbi:MAG: hypothetical protein J5857_03980 [Treponema sp.]|nr:hypothetical protein [Treponema sp.]
MESNEALEKVLNSYRGYYNIKTEDVDPPFVAEAVFQSSTEKFLLVKAAKIADIDSNEYVFFAKEENLSPERLMELDSKAWERGISKVEPHENHRNSDVILIVIADNIEDSVFTVAKKLKHYKSYRFTFWGWSHYRLIAYDCSTGKFACNRMGKDLRKVFA